MYKIEQRSSGYLMRFSGEISLMEINSWYYELQQIFKREKGAFSLVADMRNLRALKQEVSDVLFKGMSQYQAQNKGKRSAVVMDNPVALTHIKSLGTKAGIAATERYLDANKDAKAIEKAIEWVKNGTEPY